MSVNTYSENSELIGSVSEILGVLNSDGITTVRYREGYDMEDIRVFLTELTAEIEKFIKRPNWEKFYEVPDEFRARFSTIGCVEFRESYDIAETQTHVENSISYFEGLIAEARREYEARVAREEEARLEEELRNQLEEEARRKEAEEEERLRIETEEKMRAAAEAERYAYELSKDEEITFDSGESHSLEIDDDDSVVENLMDQVLTAEDPYDNYEEVERIATENQKLEESIVSENLSEELEVSVIPDESYAEGSESYVVEEHSGDNVEYDADFSDEDDVDQEEAVWVDESASDDVEHPEFSTVQDESDPSEDNKEVNYISLVEFIAALEYVSQNNAKEMFAPVVVQTPDGEYHPVTSAFTTPDGFVQLRLG